MTVQPVFLPGGGNSQSQALGISGVRVASTFLALSGEPEEKKKPSSEMGSVLTLAICVSGQPVYRSEALPSLPRDLIPSQVGKPSRLHWGALNQFLYFLLLAFQRQAKTRQLNCWIPAPTQKLKIP